MTTAVDLEGMSRDDLLSLQKQVDKAIKSFEERNLQNARQAAEAAAQEYGVTLAEVMQTKSSKKQSLLPAKYSNPDDPSQTWSGRGRRPKWFLEAIEAGKTEQDLEIG